MILHIWVSTTINDKGIEAGILVWKLVTKLDTGSLNLEKDIPQVIDSSAESHKSPRPVAMRFIWKRTSSIKRSSIDTSFDNDKRNSLQI
ncbi:hypothetical protein KAX35_07945 [candidate division WOR-3 bacterium]|nr:hypothetical protein [candidate division WOR-3 bacterium]